MRLATSEASTHTGEVRDASLGAEDFGCQAVDSIIHAESELRSPIVIHKTNYEAKRDAHQNKYPGGILPRELRCFEDYTKVREESLECAERAKLQCLSCGKFPWP